MNEPKTARDLARKLYYEVEPKSTNLIDTYVTARLAEAAERAVKYQGWDDDDYEYVAYGLRAAILGDHAPAAKSEETAEDRYYWWCTECHMEVDGRNVTYEGFHDRCGTRVVSKLEAPASEGDLHRLLHSIIGHYYIGKAEEERLAKSLLARKGE